MMLAFPTFTTMMHNARLRAVARVHPRRPAGRARRSAEAQPDRGVRADGRRARRRRLRVASARTRPVRAGRSASSTWPAPRSTSSKAVRPGRQRPVRYGRSLRPDHAPPTCPAAEHDPVRLPRADERRHGERHVRRAAVRPGPCRANGGDMRCLRVVVTPGGRVRMCDPSVPAAANDDAFLLRSEPWSSRKRFSRAWPSSRP